MGKESFLLVSLNEDKAKKLAQIITNETCKKILEYLTDKEGTETEIAENLGLPISTVHYNLQQLKESGLITADTYHYSKKGKEILHYKLANKYIIIAPKSTYGIKEKLRAILPATLIVAGTAFTIALVSKLFGILGRTKSETFSIMAKTAAVSQPLADQAIQRAGDLSVQGAQSAQANIYSFLQSNILIWFIIGAAFSATIYIACELLKKEK